MQHSEAQIFALAPDEASKKAGIGLASPSKWITRGINELALWGECQGSGSKPYQTQIDLTTIAFKCSCPSRKFPCKHGLGLMLLHAQQPNLFIDFNMPAWVNDWISKRSEKEVKKAEIADKPIDEVAQAKRREARTQKVNAGIQELLVWLKDIIRNGILGMPEKGANYWDNMARRMIDAQASGLATMVKTLAETKFWEEGWQSDFMDAFLRLYTVAESYQNLSGIDSVLQQDILRTIGFTTSLEELKTQDGTKDTWLVLGKETNAEGALTVEQNWLYGVQSNQYALVLQFYAKGQPAVFSLIPGTYLDTELVYFPSAVPYRALIKNSAVLTTALPDQNGFADWQQLALYESKVTSSLPFYEDMPVLIQQVVPVKIQQAWWLKDQQGYLCKIASSFKYLWKLLALSGGAPITIAVIGKENNYMPIGVYHQNIYKALS